MLQCFVLKGRLDQAIIGRTPRSNCRIPFKEGAVNARISVAGMALCGVFLLSGCGVGTSAQVIASPTGGLTFPTVAQYLTPPTVTPTTALPSPTATQNPSPTPSAAPSATPIPTVQASPTSGQALTLPSAPLGPTATPVPAAIQDGKTQRILVFLVLLNDNGKTGWPVGCGDSVVPVEVRTEPTQAVLKAAIQALLDLGEPVQPNLYNALSRAKVSLQRVELVQGVASIYLTGELLLGGVCDDPRAQAQLEQTALQFKTVRSVRIFLNGVPLQQALSEKD